MLWNSYAFELTEMHFQNATVVDYRLSFSIKLLCVHIIPIETLSVSDVSEYELFSFDRIFCELILDFLPCNGS